MKNYTKTFRKEQLKFGQLFTYLAESTEAVKVKSIELKDMDSLMENKSYKDNYIIKGGGIKKVYEVTLKHQASFLHTLCFLILEENGEYINVIYPNGNVGMTGKANLLNAVDFALERAIWNTYSRT